MRVPNIAPAKEVIITPYILTLNAGSSSIKFAFFSADATPERLLHGKMERVGLADPILELIDLSSNSKSTFPVTGSDQATCARFLLDFLSTRYKNYSLQAVGHRIVHGGRDMFAPTRIDDKLMSDLKRISNLAPSHLPVEILLIEEISRRHPTLPQLACFDTGFHASMPQEAKLLPLPRKYFERGVQRYGFHGISYSYIVEELERLQEPAIKNGRVVIAHLGNGASMAAVKNGRSVDTTMAFTPAGGLVMSSRSGDLDPGILTYFALAHNFSPEQLHRMVTTESGLLGLSETSSDVRDLLALEATDERAGEALSIFCYQARKWIGALAAAMGGLELLVFAGGIGENSAVIRHRICDELAFLGVVLDPIRNERNDFLISTERSPVRVLRVQTDEEAYIARNVYHKLTEGNQ